MLVSTHQQRVLVKPFDHIDCPRKDLDVGLAAPIARRQRATNVDGHLTPPHCQSAVLPARVVEDADGRKRLHVGRPVPAVLADLAALLVIAGAVAARAAQVVVLSADVVAQEADRCVCGE